MKGINVVGFIVIETTGDVRALLVMAILQYVYAYSTSAYYLENIRFH